MVILTPIVWVLSYNANDFCTKLPKVCIFPARVPYLGQNHEKIFSLVLVFFFSREPAAANDAVFG